VREPVPNFESYNKHKEKSVRRIAIALGTIAVALVASAGTAWAHVSVQPSEAPKGGFATLTFKVPNEKDDASTTKVEISFPKDQPIADASVQPVPGWTVNVGKTKLTTPVTSDEGDTLDEQLSTVTFTANSGGGIKAGEFQTFLVSVQLPDEGDSLGMPTTQTYSDGEDVEWNEATPDGGPEPEHPMPTVMLTAGGDEHGGSATPTTVKEGDGASAAGTAAAASAVKTAQDDADNAKTLGIIGLVAGILALIVAIVALAMSRRKPAAS
jgi:uncharacterized protein YcnI